MHLCTSLFPLLTGLGSSSISSFSRGLSLPDRMEGPSGYRPNVGLATVLLRMGLPCR
jgi:hypothetical protein